jgi:hypothetical protein
MKESVERLGLDLSAMRGQGWNRGLGNGRDKEKQLAAGRRWYRKNPQVYIDRNDRRRRDRIRWVRELKNAPCMDCDGRFPWYVMDFDHRDGEEKAFNIGDAVRGMVGLERFRAEIAKCDLVCSNCHRIRTAKRAGWEDEVLLSRVSQDT